jgi:transcriptional regulator with XRE-family HTH domain
MPPNRFSSRRRTSTQVRSDERAAQLATFLGRALRDARLSRRVTQREAAARAGLSQACWSGLERGRAAAFSLRVWVRAGDAVGSDLRAYLERATATSEPRDQVHLRHQALMARKAAPGGWQIMPEADLGGAGVADILLTRGAQAVLVEVWDYFSDVGAAFRSWDRKLARIAVGGYEQVSGVWVVRATRRNRELVGNHREVFRARFPERGTSWLGALESPGRPAPVRAGLLWVSVRGDRLYPARLGEGRP